MLKKLLESSRYAPTEAYFDRSWKLPDLERVK